MHKGHRAGVARNMGLCLAQDVTPTHLMAASELAARTCFGWDRDAVTDGVPGPELAGNAGPFIFPSVFIVLLAPILVRVIQQGV
jgi:hypothetical protein